MTTRSNKELIDITKQLISIESTEDNRAGLVEAYDIMVKMLINCGKNITIEHFEREGKPSLLAYRGPQRPDNFRIILNGHVDVIGGRPTQFKPVIKDGKLYGRGVYDMKAAAVILTDLFCEYVDKVPYALGLQIVTDEEASGENGTSYQVSQGVRGDFIICGECGRAPGTYEIANEAKGVARLNMEFGGTSSHGAYLWRGQNAILAAAEFSRRILERYPLPTDAVAHTTVNISSIATDNASMNRVPDHAKLTLDIRFSADDPNFRSKQHVAALIEEVDPNAKITRFVNFEAPVFASPKNPMLQQLKAAAEAIEGHKFKFVRRHGTSDGRFYGNVGDQACEFGITGDNHHADDEYITLEAFDIYRTTMRKFLQTSITSEAQNTRTAAYKAE